MINGRRVCSLDWKAASEPLRSATSWTSEHETKRQKVGFIGCGEHILVTIRKRYTCKIIYVSEYMFGTTRGYHYQGFRPLNGLEIPVSGRRTFAFAFGSAAAQPFEFSTPLPRGSLSNAVSLSRRQKDLKYHELVNLDARTPDLWSWLAKSSKRKAGNISHPSALEAETTTGNNPCHLGIRCFLKLGLTLNPHIA